MTSTPARIIPHRTRTLVLGLGIPALVAVAVFVILRSWIPDLPDQVATHWGSGGPDGFSAASSVAWPALLIIPCAAVCAAIAWWWGQDGFSRRMALATSWFLTVFLAGLFLALTGAQRGLEDARDVGNADPWIFLTLGLGIVAAVAGWFLMPGNPPSDGPGGIDPATRHLPVRDGERVAWIRSVHQRGLLPVLAVAGVVALALAAGFGGTGEIVLVVVSTVILFVLVGLFSTARVIIDGSGLTVLLGPGIRVRHIAARDIGSVEVVEVRPLREFGGWGIRIGRSGTVGVVLQSGPGIQVVVAGDRRFVVTVDDARTGASLLAGVALRAQEEEGLPRG